jgi:DNA-binding XRE family transcriptional regulator
MPKTKKWSVLRDEVLAQPGAATAVAEHSKRIEAEREAYTLAELRRGAGVTQAQLAQAIGRSQSAVSQMENGQFSLTVDVLRSIVEQVGGKLAIVAQMPKGDIELLL